MQREDGVDQERTAKMVEVARFENPVEAQMAKGMLESAGIECELTGEHANLLIQSAFGAQLEVREEDEAAARQLLDSAGEKTGVASAEVEIPAPPEG